MTRPASTVGSVGSVGTRRPPTTARAWTLVGVGVLGIALAAPIGSATAAPALAVAFWRSAFGAAATAPVVAVRARWRSELTRLGAAGWRGCLLSGVLLALHFALWIPSLRLTSVTVSTALVATTPVWTVALHRLTGVHVPGRVIGGVALALAGVVAITGVDGGGSSRALLGDLLALGGGMAAAGYTLMGERMRRSTSTPVYTVVVYAWCALVLAPVCVLAGWPLGGYSTRTWVELAILTVAAQLLGHSALNAAVATVGSTALSSAILLEVPGAALVAWVWLGQVPPLLVLPGAGLVLIGLVVVGQVTPSHPDASVAGE